MNRTLAALGLSLVVGSVVPAVAQATHVNTGSECLIRNGIPTLVTTFHQDGWPLGSAVDETAAINGAIFHSVTHTPTSDHLSDSGYSLPFDHEVTAPLSGPVASVHAQSSTQAFLPGAADVYREASFDKTITCPTILAPGTGIDQGSQPPVVAPPRPVQLFPTISLRKDASRPRQVSGGNVGFRISVRNTSRVVAYGIDIVDPLGSNITLRLVPSGAKVRNGSLVFHIPLLHPGETWTRWIRTRVVLGNTTLDDVCNTVTATLRHKDLHATSCVLVSKPTPKPGRTAG